MPLGAFITEHGCNFSVYGPDAEHICVCLFDENEKEIAQIPLKQREQSRWYGCISNVKHGQLYGYRVRPKASRNIVDSSFQKLLIDPYAKQLNRPLIWNKQQYEGDSQAMLPKCVVIGTSIGANISKNIGKSTETSAKASVVDSTGLSLPAKKRKHQRDNNQRIIYEAHIKGLTMQHPEVPEEQRGTYLGAMHPAIFKHLKRLGITSVQFLPLMSFMAEPFVENKGLTNYWGYNPINFFAPEPRYAIDDALSECKAMIKAYQEHGFEVILDVVFNHTAESGFVGPILSFKGFCASHAYITEQPDETDEVEFMNFSGCGNTVKVWDSYMQMLILDAMRYWLIDMGIDGFRFDLAATLGREQLGFHPKAAFFKIIDQDPILQQAILIAEPWDIGPGGYQLGHFPANWIEVNDKFRDCVRGFWREDEGLKGEFATRLMGSKDIFRKSVRPMHASLNNVTYHDGFTLHDLVCYEQKHNEKNLEENRDGHNHNLSRNYGVEGETQNPDIIALREQQKRNLFASLILSQGTPHILGGDELSRTQQGNNNAYCQDNELNYYDWNLSNTQEDFLAYCSDVIALRQQYPLLQCMHFKDDQFSSECNIAEAYWYRKDGSNKRDIDWVNEEHHCFALHLKSTAQQYTTGLSTETQATHSTKLVTEEWVFVINSAESDKHFTLSMLAQDEAWQCMLDTSLASQSACADSVIEAECLIPAHSMRIYRALM